MINSSSGFNKSKMISRRMFVISVAKIVVFSGIFARLISLQINESKKYLTLSDKNRFREWRLAPQRGLIKDYFGKEIASNEKVYQLHITPENTANINELFFRLQNILNLSNKKISSLKKKISKQKPWEPLIVSENMSWSDFSKVNLFLHELQGVEPVVSVARFYPNKSTSHIVGYVSEISAKDLKSRDYLKEMSVSGIAVGKTGLENNLDKDIIGKVGFQRYEVNAFGKRIKQIKIDKGQAGQDFTTTIDLEIQNYTSKLIENLAASVCVMDIYNGDIITMASAPVYDPNVFVHGINNKDWQFLLNHRDKPLTNKSLAGLYPPGSTIKTIVALSALENKVWNPKKIINCNGKIEMYGEKFHCWEKKGHGRVNMRTAIKRSCDVYFYEVARLLGVDRLSITAEKFGLGKKVLVDFLEERSGVVPNTKWKKKYIGQNWYIGETLHSGIGQGYYLTTPLQLCLMTAQIANGGYRITPKIISDSTDRRNDLEKYLKNKDENIFNPLTNPFVSNFDQQKLFRNQENINFIKDAMYGATNEPGGTSYRSRFKSEKFMFAGKTGSSQIKKFTELQRESEVKQNEIVYGDRDHAWFVAFAPVKNPKYAISVLVEHGGSGSSAAAPIAKKVIKKTLERHEARSSKNGEEI